MRRGIALTAWACASLLGALLAWRLAGTPALILFAALVPALAYGAAVVRVDRFERQPAVLLLVLFLWGAGAAAVLATGANDAAQTWLGQLRDAEHARALTPRLAAPAIEELIKAAALVVLVLTMPAAIGVLGGMIYGALIGIGFTMTENVTYFILAAVQGGELGLVQSIYLRGLLAGLNHAAFTATVGAAIGWSAGQRGGRRWVVPLIGLAAAIAEHVVWNALAADAINDLICNAITPGSACRTPATPTALFVGAPLIVALCIGPPLLGLAVWARRARRDEGAVVAQGLRNEVGAAGLTAAQYAELCSPSARRRAERRALRGGGLSAWAARRRFHRVGTELALLRRARSADAEPGLDEQRCRDEFRALASAQRNSPSTTPI